MRTKICLLLAVDKFSPVTLCEQVGLRNDLEAGRTADLVSQRETLSIQVPSLGPLNGLIQRRNLHSLPARNTLHDSEELTGAAGGGHVGANVGVELSALLEHAYVDH